MSLDDPKLDSKQYFKTYIKNQSIDQLLEKDNKIFTEIKSLENEKHILVTQNYKKFVSATETINSIKFSLTDFESNLMTLQDKIGKLVTSFNKVNDKIEPFIKKADNVYSLKRDLKRLKFINDLPNILEQAYSSYQKSENKDISTFEKPLLYYQKCKDFLSLHKEHSLVSDVYNKSQELIYKYKQIIEDYLIIPDFSESQLNLLKVCISLLIKIDNCKSDLILIFVERYKQVINKKFDEFFAMKENITEIDYQTYLKIYNTFEFSINENEFCFYENQINELDEQKTSSVVQRYVELSSLSSKYFKKGTLIWICKKITENIVAPIIDSAYSSFKELFDDRYISNLNIILNSIVDIYMKKMNSYVSDSSLIMNKENKLSLAIDSIFFKEALSSFQQSFFSSLSKIRDEKIHTELITDSILKVNTNLINQYLNKVRLSFENDIDQYTTLSYNNLIKTQEFFLEENTTSTRYNKLIAFDELEALKENITKSLITKIKIIKELDYSTLLSSNSDSYSIEIYKNISNLIGSIIQSFSVKAELNKINCFIGIIFLKSISSNDYTKTLIEKISREVNEKTRKIIKKDLKEFIDKKLTEQLFHLQLLLINNQTQILLKNQKILFINEKNSLYSEKSNILSFRKDLRDLLISFFLFKKDIYSIFDEEKKLYMKKQQGDTIFNKNVKKHGTVQHLMESIKIKQLIVYEEYKLDSPQEIIEIICKIFLKNMIELCKFKKINKYLHSQFNFDLFFIKSFFSEFIMIDHDNLKDGFFREIKEILKSNCFEEGTECNIDSDLHAELWYQFKKEFSSVLVEEN